MGASELQTEPCHLFEYKLWVWVPARACSTCSPWRMWGWHLSIPVQPQLTRETSQQTQRWMSSAPQQLYFCLPHQLVQDFCLRFWRFPVCQWGEEDHKSASSHQHWHPCDSLRFGNPPAIRRWTLHEILTCLLFTCTVLPRKVKVPSPFISQ